MEKHYAFIKDNRLVLVAVFESENTEVADLVKSDHNYDSYVWLGNATPPKLYSSYDGTVFTDPTFEYLLSIGIANPEPEVTEPTE
jgi:hypothetical protein